MQAEEFRDKTQMTVSLRKIILAVLIAVLAVGVSACGSKNPNEKLWPNEGIAASVPVPEAGTVSKTFASNDAGEDDYAVIVVDDFTVENMGDYVRLLLKKGYKTVSEQNIVDNAVYYTAKKDGVRVSLRLDTETNQMKIEIE